MLRSLLVGFLSAALLLNTIGCATIISGDGPRTVEVSSTPAGATVFVRQSGDWTRHSDPTPTTVRVDAHDGPVGIRLELDGYESTSTSIGTSVDPWFFGSLGLIVLFVVPGLVATGIDLYTGAWKKVETDSYHATLRALGAGNEQPQQAALSQ